ncbi:MAG: 50S ribosomal protein L18e [Candidatus Woesearchaeota archaeon]|jgi:large subunit ribosomal protein L18e|nr:50S ribosomal protein L18e [Candidatus Woesearchaeota archaeon]MDP7506611.1 50S ribosomal protein L18e [Candidatus Woesearchaeota archaeon]MDP7610266.1 50S ribosomal protein L18e [Candidatus Woesearchaeota archaeon]|tara:strand:- start:812 stop:1177 length:366 start_codon:yes stop_codon:yes gene_type:complete
MVKRTGPTNSSLISLIESLKALGSENNVPLWKRIAKELEKPRRNARAVNLSKINKYTKEDEVIIVPGKVLGDGVLEHKLTIGAFSYSKSALEKINKAQAKAMLIKDFMGMDIKGKRIRIIG